MRKLPWLALVGCLTCTAAWAADAENAAAPKVQETYWYYLQFGWQVNMTVGIMAFISLFLFLHVMLMVRPSLTVPPDMLREMLTDIASGDRERALRRATESRALLGKLMIPALRLTGHTQERLHQITEGAGRRLVGALRQRATYIANIGVLCPMLGLLGTVMGMITIFETFGAQLDLAMKQKMLMAGVSKAMITTAVGLLAGIPSMAGYYLAIGKVNRVADDLELAAEELVATMGDRNQ